MAWSKHFLLALFTIINEGSSVNIERCQENRVTIVEGRNDTITCSGISYDRDVLWEYRSQDDEVKYIGRCYSYNYCYTPNTDVELSREGGKSSLFLLGNERKYGEGEVRCEQINLIASNKLAVCTMSVTSLAKQGRCDLALDLPSWSMNVSCLLYQVFTSSGFYACALVLNKETTPGYGNFYSYTDSGKMYVRGICSITARLPTEEGEYKYYIASTPPLARYSEYKLIMDRPGGPDVSSCPRYVQATANVNCLCDVNPPGNPPAEVWWEDQLHSATLVLINVQHNDNDRRFTCHLSWGTYRNSTSYQLRVAYGPNTVNISRSPFWVTNHLKFANLTCNASGYSPDVTYAWNVPCQSEALVDHASVCSTSFHEKTKVMCTAVNSQFPAINATAVITVYHEGEIQNSKDTGLIGAVVGGALGIIAIVSLCTGLAVYLKRRKVSEFVDYTNETYLTSSDVSSTEIHNASRFDEKHDGVCNKDPTTEEHSPNSSSVSPNTRGLLESEQNGSISSDVYAVPVKRTKGREGSSEQQINPTSSAVNQPVSLPVSRVIQNERQCLDGAAGSRQNISGSLYENIGTCRINEIRKVQKRSSEESEEAVQKEEIQPQSENDGVEYNRLDFSRNIRLSESLTESAPVYDHLNDG